MIKPKICILRTDGTNCDEELSFAFEKFGGNPHYVHINELRAKRKLLKNFQILALPGGFAYGDDVASGKILAVELMNFLKDQLTSYISNEGLIIGICNGFQALIRTGLLPFGNLGQMDATLAQNNSGHFECRWIKLKIEKSKCVFLNSNSGQIGDLAINHGEGRFFASAQVISRVENQKLIIARYVDEKGNATSTYPANPSGSINAIAGVTDPTGRILGIMPHPEKFVLKTQHPNWRRQKLIKPHGAFIFENMIKFAKG